jgi:hypothetical protein
MSSSTALRAGIIAVTVAIATALAFERVYDVSFRVRPPDPLDIAADQRSRGAMPPLALRLVDSGGVGIPLDAWGSDYSHDRRAFRHVILERPPYIDADEFARVERDWRLYVERMLEYGNNAIAVPLLLEFIDFDRVRRPDGSPAVYGADSEFRARHAAVRRYFGPLFDWTAKRGMRVFLDADMLSLTAPLADYLREQAPDRGRAAIDTANPAVWDVYRAGLEELFDEVPSITGLVVRFGEGGDLYNTSGWPYRSEMAVRTPAALRAMLRGLLPVFESTGRTYVLRSWTVGVGPLGRLHVDPRIYQTVLGDIDSPALVVSTKFTAGDFFSYLPLNPTLAAGRHRRLIELQARPEFEGAAAFPDFLGEEYAHALRALRARNPRIAGTYVFTQFGGPLRAGPRTLYPLLGFWRWSDANVYVASRLAADPDADVTQLTRQWAARTFGGDMRVVDAVVGALSETRAAVLQGFYIRPFAEHEVHVPGLELPPLMWVFEWDMIGGWHSLLSIVYRGIGEEVDAAVDEGYAATNAVRRAREHLQAAFAAAPPGGCADVCGGALRSLEYQETLFDALAAWRQAFLSYYHWLDTGDTRSWDAWREGRARFERAAGRHVAEFGHDLDFPAFDFTSATRAVAMAGRTTLARTTAGALLVVIVIIVAVPSAAGRLMLTTAVAPWRLARTAVDLRSVIAVTLVSLTIVGLIAATLTGFTAPELGAASALMLGVCALVFDGAATWPAGGRGRGRLLVSACGSVLPAAAVLLGTIAYLGPLGVWYRFWTLPAFRVTLLTVACASVLWTVFVLLSVRAGDGWRGRIAGALSAAGVALVTLAWLVPDGTVLLRALDRPLNLAPATDTMLFALRTYAGVNLEFNRWLSLPGAVLLMAGIVLSLTRRTADRRAAPASL